MAPTKMRSFGVSSRVGHSSDEFYNRKIHAEHSTSDDDESQEIEVPESCLDRIYIHSSETMRELPDNCIHLMVTSPPYNVGKDYDDDLSQEEYLDLLDRVWRETYRVLAPGGRACINVANLGRKPYIPLNAMITRQMQDIGFLMRGEIIWHKSASAGTSCAWGSWMSPANPVLRDTHEYILVFSKREFSRKKPTGENRQPTITRDEFLEVTKSVWTFPAASAKSVNHPAPFPLELPARLIELYTYSGDVVLDPFLGAGTTAVAAAKANRHYIGYEISTEYVEVAMARLVRELES